MRSRPLSARDLIGHLHYVHDIDAPVIVKRGLFGHEFTYVRAHGTIATPDFGMRFKRPLPELVLADAIFDNPEEDWGPHRRAKDLQALLVRINEAADRG